MPGTVNRKLLPMGERKLMPMGKGGLVMTIPKVWIRFFELEVGDTVELEMDSDGGLHIRPKEAAGPEKDRGDGEKS